MDAPKARRDLVSIGEFSRMTHLTIKALRHYDAEGVLAPWSVDETTGYRSYHLAQVPTAQAVRRLRDLGMPLDDLREVIGTDDVTVRADRIAQHLDHMERELDGLRSTVLSLRALIGVDPALETLPPGSGVQPDVELRLQPATWAFSLRTRTSLDEAGAWLGQAYAAVEESIDTAGAVPDGPRGALFYPDVFEREQGDLAAFVPVRERPARDRAAASSDLGAAVRSTRLRAREVAVMTHHGSCADIDWTYGTLGQFVAQRALGVDGPIGETFLVGPSETSDATAHRTEVAWPIFRTRADASA